MDLDFFSSLTFVNWIHRSQSKNLDPAKLDIEVGIQINESCIFPLRMETYH